MSEFFIEVFCDGQGTVRQHLKILSEKPDFHLFMQVHQELSQHTLHLCVAMVDHFLCLQDIELKILQLVGITSMLIAAKYHERFPPEVHFVISNQSGLAAQGKERFGQTMKYVVTNQTVP